METTLKEKFISMEQASDLLGVKKTWFYDKVRKGKVPFYKIGKYNKFLVSELLAWVASEQVDQKKRLEIKQAAAEGHVAKLRDELLEKIEGQANKSVGKKRKLTRIPMQA